MPRGSKTHHTDKREREVEDIVDGYVERGVSRREATRRAWATVNAIHGRGQRRGDVDGPRIGMAPARKSGRKRGRTAHRRPRRRRAEG